MQPFRRYGCTNFLQNLLNNRLRAGTVRSQTEWRPTHVMLAVQVGRRAGGGCSCTAASGGPASTLPAGQSIHLEPRQPLKAMTARFGQLSRASATRRFSGLPNSAQCTEVVQALATVSALLDLDVGYGDLLSSRCGLHGARDPFHCQLSASWATQSRRVLLHVVLLLEEIRM